MLVRDLISEIGVENIVKVTSDKDFDINLKSIDDVQGKFLKYTEWLNRLYYKGVTIKHIEDDCLSLKGVYVADLNSKWMIKRVSNFEAASDINNFGVCDNAEQAISYYEHYEEVGELDMEKDYIIILTPMAKNGEAGADGWRWSKWGSYIGHQKPEYEYIADEPNIELVYVFEIVEVKAIK